MRTRNKVSIPFLVALLFCLTSLLTNAAGVTPTLTTATYPADGSGGTIAPNPPGPTYAYGQSVTLTANPAAGWKFVEWRGDVTEAAEGWWDANFDYRVLITLGGNGYDRTDKPAEVAINFTTLLNAAGQTAAFDPDSIRVVEINSTGQVMDGAVPFQFDRALDYNSKSKAVGELVFLMRGTTPAAGERFYHVYFDVIGKNFTTPVFTDYVILVDKDAQGKPIEDPDNKRSDAYKITTVVPSTLLTTTYYYDLEGGGFSGLEDNESNDWISYRRNVDGPGGTFRGIPNAVFPEGNLHPGDNNSETEIVQGGPLKETIRSRTTDGLWDVTWEIFPAYARLTVNKAGHNFWVLYEGTPGGSIIISGSNADFYGLSNNIIKVVGQDYPEESEPLDLVGEEWVYFADPTLDRAIFLAHHEDDGARDSYKYQSDDFGAMVVWGFGRNNNPTEPEISNTSLPHHVTIGLFDLDMTINAASDRAVSYPDAAKLIRAAYKDLSIAISSIESRTGIANPDPGSNPTLTLTMTSNRQITAIFEPQ